LYDPAFGSAVWALTLNTNDDPIAVERAVQLIGRDHDVAGHAFERLFWGHKAHT
jgi:hypothetical protein